MRYLAAAVLLLFIGCGGLESPTGAYFYTAPLKTSLKYLVFEMEPIRECGVRYVQGGCVAEVDRSRRVISAEPAFFIQELDSETLAKYADSKRAEFQSLCDGSIDSIPFDVACDIEEPLEPGEWTVVAPGFEGSATL